MSTSDILTLVAMCAGFLVCACGLVAWFHLFMASEKERAREELKEAIRLESEARKEEDKRIMEQVKSLTELNMTVGLMGKSIEHLTEKFVENQLSMSEVKTSLGNIDNRINQIALDAAKRAPRQRPRTRKDKVNATLAT